nr:neuronal acetylcholine receptor subunit alpha-7-like [Biomphalaria glabrata]
MKVGIAFWSLMSTVCIVDTLGGAEDIKSIFRALFDNYSTEIRPCYNYSHATDVQIYLSVSTVLELDLKRQILNFIGFFSFAWTDELLHWDPESFHGIQVIEVPQNKVWKPDIAIYNSVNDVSYLGNENVLASISSVGLVRWEPAVNLAVTCKVDITRFPFDENICTINLTSWMHDNSTIHLTPAEEPILQDQMMPNGQYWVEAAGTMEVYSNYYGKFYKTLGFKLKFSRRPNYLIMTFLVPVTLLGVLCVVSFLLSPEEPEKVSVAITVLLSFTVFLGVVDNDLPETSDHMCLIVSYVVLLLVLSFLSVAGNAVVVVIHKRDVKRGQHSPLAFPSETNLHSVRRGKKDNSGLIIFNCVVQGKVGLPPLQPQDALQEKSEADDNDSVDEKTEDNVKVPRAYRLNKYCLILNSLALMTIITVFSILMIH